MPAAMINPSAANYNISGLNGWDSRYIYHYGTWGADNNEDLLANGAVYDDNIFETIDANFEKYKGNYTLPTLYITTGRQYVVKGHIIVQNKTNSILDMVTGIVPGVNTLVPLASTNNGNDHNFYADAASTNVPVEFEIHFLFKTDVAGYAYCRSFGYYTYNAIYKTAGYNDITYRVPVYTFSAGVPYTSLGLITDQSLKFSISFDGSVNIDNIWLQYLTIQEII